MKKINEKGGLTLIETAVSLAIAAVVLVSLANVVEVSKDNWSVNQHRLEMLHESRLALGRIAAEVRYATHLIQASTGMSSFLEFASTNIIDDDSGVENILYYTSSVNGLLYRQADGGPINTMAGESSVFPQVQSMGVTPLKLDGSNNLVPLTGGDVLAVDAIAVEVDLTMVDEDGYTLRATTIVNLRNKT